MINCQNMSSSDELQHQRLSQAEKILGKKVILRILCFALYLLGFQRSCIARALETPAGTVKSVIRAVLRDGLPALEDRRGSASTFLPAQKKEVHINVERREHAVGVDLKAAGSLEIPRENHLQIRVVLLTMLISNLLTTREVAEVLGFSTVHTINLAHRLHADDVVALLDRREGQKQEYRFTAEVKAELIQQFVLDTVTSGRVSGKLLAEHLNERCKLSLSERSIREQLVKSGLSRIKRSLPVLLKGAKKNSTGSSKV